MSGSGAKLKREERRLQQFKNKHLGALPTPPEPQKTFYLQFEPRSTSQGHMLSHMAASPLVFAIGPAGVGKTALAINYAAGLLIDGRVDKLILSRPAVCADEDMGYLPGELEDKMAPYLIPLYDELAKTLGGGRRAELVIQKWKYEKKLEIAPLAFMRGRTFERAAIVLDEMQNATVSQLHMATTRLGDGSCMIVLGDPDQFDIRPELSGFSKFLPLLERYGFPVIRFHRSECRRHPVVARILNIMADHPEMVDQPTGTSQTP